MLTHRQTDNGDKYSILASYLMQTLIRTESPVVSVVTVMLIAGFVSFSATLYSTATC